MKIAEELDEPYPNEEFQNLEAKFYKTILNNLI